MLADTVGERPDRPAYRWFVEGGGTKSVTWGEFHHQVRQAAKSLLALGIEKDEKVNILSYTCYRWVLADQAISAAGACTVGIYQSLLAEDCQYIIDHSDVVLIFAEDQAQLDKLIEVRDRIPAVRKVVMLTADYSSEDDWVMSFEDLLAAGAEVTDEDLDARTAAIEPGDLAAIVYTSGTTGVPKGAMLTHDNLTFTAQAVVESIAYEEGDVNFTVPADGPCLRPQLRLRHPALRPVSHLRPRHGHRRRGLEGGPAALVPERAADLREGLRQGPGRRRGPRAGWRSRSSTGRAR